MNLIANWFQRNFSNPEVVMLLSFLIIGIAFFYFFGKMLAPAVVALVISYLLNGLVRRLTNMGVPQLISVMLVFLLFLALLLFFLFGLLPLLTRQLTHLVQQIPNYISQGQVLLQRLPELYPELINQAQLNEVIARLGADFAGGGQQILAWSLSSVLGLVSLLVFLVLVPILVFFMMKDQQKIVDWIRSYLPGNRNLVSSVWSEVDDQIGNYVRGKTVEILIVGVVTYIVFLMLGLQYAALLATIVGFSVLVPYIGAAVVTLPVALVAFFQFGWGWDFGAILVAYGIIQGLDGNVLVPVLFSEVVNLHPVAIIVAILFFGGLWGFWGVFFAIPLATLVSAILSAWPREEIPESLETAS
ncbi:MAG: AI-2E family transporter [Xanthomonadales bacterium]|nr:AI-2E family transporter [Xanthomonadales bacterium]